jgi:hypothetical protein
MKIVEYQNDLQYAPPAMGCDVKLHPQIKDPLPNAMCPFMTFIGSAGSGKTSLAISMLTNSDMYHKCFHHVFLVVPNNSRMSIKGDVFKNIPDEQTFDELTPDVLEHVLSFCEQESKEGHYTLLFMDDCAVALKNKTNETLLKKLIFNRRHLKLHIWCLVQSYNSMSLSIRKNISHACIFRPRNKKELALLFEELMPHSKEEVEVLAKHIWKEPFSFMFLNTGEGKVFRNFNLLTVED